MSSASIFATQLPVGRLVLLAWIMGALLTSFGFDIHFDFNADPHAFIYQAALLFGNYLSFSVVVRIVSVIPGVFSKCYRSVLTPESNWIRVMNVIAMLITFSVSAVSLRSILGVVGLFIGLAYYVSGKLGFSE